MEQLESIGGTLWETLGIVVALRTVGIGLYALHWARKGELVQPAVAVAGNEASAESEEATEIEPSTALEDTATSLESERAP